jgi:photosystem II stability/assembly factor-like uncharacterized protein
MKKILLLLISYVVSSSVSGQNPNWKLVYAGNNAMLGKMLFVDSVKGYVVEKNSILSTMDAGLNWKTDTTLLNFQSIENFLLYKDTLFVITKDSLANWHINKLSKDLFPLSSTKSSLDSVFLRTSISSDSGLIGVSSNDYLELLRAGNLHPLLLAYAIMFFDINDQHLTVTTNDTIYLSDDLGANWQKIGKKTFSGTWPRVYYNGSDTLYLNGYGFPSQSEISYDKGKTWNQWLNLSSPQPLGIIFTNSTNLLGWGVRKNFIYVSTDKGFSFNTPDTLNAMISYLHHKEKNEVFATGFNGEIYKSINLGGLVGLKVNKGIESKRIAVVPNPASTVLYLQNPDNIAIRSIKIVDVKGEVVKRMPANSLQFDISSLSSGHYFILMETKQGEVRQKFIKN